MRPEHILCCLVEELPAPHVPSTEFKCSVCGRPVWVSDRQTDRDELKPLCGDCFDLKIFGLLKDSRASRA